MEAKKCICCGDEKPLSMFYYNGRDRMYFGRCKVCCKKHARERWYKKKGYIYNQRRQYRQTDHGKRMEKAQRARYQENNIEKVRARRAVHKKLPSARTQKCQRCGDQAHGWHHHKGYGREHRYDVIPLCRECHEIADISDWFQKSG